MALAYLDGKFINAEKAVVGVNNRSFRYGDGFFETIKCVNGQLPLWNYHASRLFATLQTLSFEPPNYLTADYLKQRVLELAAKNQHTNPGRIRITIFRGDGGIYDPVNHRPLVLIQSWPLNPENNKMNENGLVTGDFTTGFKAADGFANLKSNNYLLYAMAALHAKKMHWNDALLLNHKGTYCDATIANLWVILNGQVITPPLSDGPVAGTMRQYIVDHLAQTGLTLVEKSITPADLLMADEVFLSNAIYGIKWVGQHAGRKFSRDLTDAIYVQLIAPLWAATI